MNTKPVSPPAEMFERQLCQLRVNKTKRNKGRLVMLQKGTFLLSLNPPIHSPSLPYDSGTRHTVAMGADRLTSPTVGQCLVSDENSSC